MAYRTPLPVSLLATLVYGDYLWQDKYNSLTNFIVFTSYELNVIIHSTNRHLVRNQLTSVDGVTWPNSLEHL